MPFTQCISQFSSLGRHTHTHTITNLDEGGGLVDPAVPHVLSVYEEEAIELLNAAVCGDGAVVLDIHDVDAGLAAVPAQPDAELLARLTIETRITNLQDYVYVQSSA